mgnify:CR=1 FL=1
MNKDLFQSQIRMRYTRKSAIQKGLISVLDVGSSKITCFILNFDGPNKFKDVDGIGTMGGQSSFRVIGAATTRSRGVKFGEIENINETERAIRTVIQASQKMAGIRVDHVIASFSGARPRSYGLEGKTSLPDGFVTDESISRAIANADIPDIGIGREVIHAQPINFSIDNRSGLIDPRGQAGNYLAVDMHMLTVSSVAIENLLYCLQRCDLEVAGVISSAYSSGMSSLVEDEQELGAACVDLGGGSTGLSIFLKKHMIYSDSIRLGGDHITNDISKGLHIDFASAERIKTFYGGVLATGMDDKDVIDLRSNTGDWEHDTRSVSRADIIGIVRPRVEEILEEVKERLDLAGFDYLPSQRIVLTGGGSQLAGFDGLASKILGQQVRLGRPLRIQGLPQAVTGPAFASCVGATLFSTNPQDEWWDFGVPPANYPTKSIKRVTKWFKENW